MKNILIVNILCVAVGVSIGYLLFNKTVSENISVKEKTEITETTRTEETVKEVEAVKSAVITKERIPEFAEKYFESVPEIKNNVARWDSITSDGFEGHVKYFIEENLFVNNFKYPERIVYKDKTVNKTTDSTKTILVKELPAFQIGGGVKSVLEKEFKVLPFCYLAANTKLWFLNATIEVKALIDNENLTVKIKPEIEGKLSIGL